MASPPHDFDMSWVSELKHILLKECGLNAVKDVCKGKPFPDSLRVEVWQICLSIDSKCTDSWDEIFDLPEQSLIRQGCQSLVDRLGNREEDKVAVMCDVESVITKHCRETGYAFDGSFLQLVQPLIALHLPKAKLYQYFNAIHKAYVPKNCVKKAIAFDLLRLLLLYHEPELCSFLDTKKITPDIYANSWLTTLFSSTCGLKVVHTMWDIYFQTAEPFLIFFLSLVIIINAKETLLEMKEENRQSIIDVLSAMPCNLEQDDVEDFCSVALYYISCTPKSFMKEYHTAVFKEEEEVVLSQALCLPVSVNDLITRSSVKADSDIKYFVVDCRPASQYNSGHLSTAFHLDASLMLHEPMSFGTAVDALFAAKEQAIAAGSVAAGEHICFLGSGRDEEDQYVHMVIASFLQKHHRYVSLAQGGYSALHKCISVSDIESVLASHCQKSCLVCVASPVAANNVNEKDVSVFDKWALAVKSRSAVVKDLLVEYITNPQTENDRHVSSNDRLGKRYRGMAPVFSIDDEHEEGERFTESDEESAFEEVSIQIWLKKPGVIGTFTCDEIRDGQMRHPSHLIVTDTHMYVLRINPQKKGYAHIVATRSLSSIVKISSKRKCPEWITFAHGYEMEDGLVISARDNLFIPKAGDATSLIKYRIYGMEEKPSVKL